MTSRHALSLSAAAFLGLLFPERCQLCHLHHATPAQGFVCEACRALVRPISGPSCSRCGLPFPGAITQAFECPNCFRVPLAFSRAQAAVEADGPARRAIHLYKYARALWLEPFFRDVWIPAALADLAGRPWTGVVPVPLHPVRQREREFNQAERLAQLLASPLGLPVRTDLVQRRLSTDSQTTLSREERAANVRRAFAPASKARLPASRWIVVDDVLTTGATTDAVAAILRKAGAEEVVVWTVARGI
ncbi:MAG: ComF family protein [Verrucomicrobiota bacterium]|jgi:ComF family protein